jgi:hypothetical protein
VVHKKSGFSIDPYHGDAAAALMADFFEGAARDPAQWHAISRGSLERVKAKCAPPSRRLFWTLSISACCMRHRQLRSASCLLVWTYLSADPACASSSSCAAPAASCFKFHPHMLHVAVAVRLRHMRDRLHSCSIKCPAACMAVPLQLHERQAGCMCPESLIVALLHPRRYTWQLYADRLMTLSRVYRRAPALFQSWL